LFKSGHSADTCLYWVKNNEHTFPIVEDPIQVGHEFASEDDHNLKPRPETSGGKRKRTQFALKPRPETSGGKRKRTHLAHKPRAEHSGGNRKHTHLAEKFNGKISEYEAMAAAFAQSKATAILAAIVEHPVQADDEVAPEANISPPSRRISLPILSRSEHDCHN
jgi:hypothetical protein